MNTALPTRLIALASAAFFTFVMVVGVNGLATAEHQDPRLAQVSNSAKA